jgi:hypothetical protein
MKNRGSIITGTLVAAAVIWATTVVGALHAIRQFEVTPGRAAEARGTWPASNRLVRSGTGSTLVMLIHPRCSCTRASLSELAQIIEKSPASMQTYILVYRPHDVKQGWEESDVLRSAKALRRTRVVIDVDGAEARRFGGFTSGQTYLYDRDGRLRFTGGITSLRGHEGLNRGRADVIQIANSDSMSATHPVFGCSIEKETKGGQR